ncbi:MAG: ASPIC/UnbV domain-containing protein [Verrucomicrobiaceae bacterium]
MTYRLRTGGSLSGREKNCAFLNLDGQRFATMSAASGFDFPDDSRALALVDWDADGRMDVWMSNRTAPRVRFLKNEVSGPGEWIQVGLESDAFLDPLGARVEVALGNGRKLLRSLRAGEGFLGQSSRWLHIGLGDEEIEGIRVRWPDGEWEEMGAVKSGKRYLCRRGLGVLKEVKVVGGKQPEEGALAGKGGQGSPWSRLPLAVPLPPFFYDDQEGKKMMWHPATGRPFLLNMWDPTCVECEEELDEWKRDWGEFPREVAVLGLMVNREVSLEEAGRFVKEREIPFNWGKVDEASLALLADILSRLYKTGDDFSAPSSFLVNGKGELVAFSRGQISVSDLGEVMDEALKGDREASGIRDWALGGKGYWLDPVEAVDLLHVPRDLLDRGYLDAGADYVRRAFAQLRLHRDIDRLLIWIGDEYMAKGKSGEGVKFYLNALQNGTKDPVVMNNVAWQFATHQDARVRDGKAAVQWAEKAIEVTGGKQATYWDTLAAAYAEVGRYSEALKAVSTGLELAKGAGEDALIPGFVKARAFYLRGKPYRN